MPRFRAFGVAVAASAMTTLLLVPHGALTRADGPQPPQPPGVPFGLCDTIDTVASSQQHPCPDADPDGKGDKDGDDDGGDGPGGL